MLAAGISKPLIFVVISVLVVALIYIPAVAYSVQNKSNSVYCPPTGKESNGLAQVKCCWTTTEGYPGIRKEVTYCSICEDGGTRGKINCTEPEKPTLTTPPRSVPPGALENLPTLEQTPPTGENDSTVPPSRGIEQPPQTGVPLKQQTADQGAAELPPATGEEELVPPCPEGQVLDEQTGLCVLEETEAAKQPEEQTQEEEEQPAEESDSEEDNSNN